MKKSIYTKPKICRSEKGWYVWFRYNGTLKRYKLGINYIKNLQEREREANALRKALSRKLKKGWNPLVPELPELDVEMTLPAALNFCIQKKKETLSAKSYSGYKGTVKFLNTAIESIGFNLLSMDEVKRAHIRKLMDIAAKQRKWSNKARNKHLNHLKALLSELIHWDIIENNPAHNIKNLPVQETEANVPATMDQHILIKEKLESEHFNFFVFVATIFHTGMRPWEILQIKIEYIDFKASEIHLPAHITKTRKERTVPINRFLMELFFAIGADEVPNNYFLFGSFRIPGRGNCGPKNDFIPGPTQLKRDTATKRWKKIVKDKMKVDVNLYSYKHFGANQKIIAGMELDVLRELYGHTSKLMTMRYAKVVKEVYRKEIMERSPKF